MIFFAPYKEENYVIMSSVYIRMIAIISDNSHLEQIQHGLHDLIASYFFHSEWDLLFKIKGLSTQRRPDWHVAKTALEWNSQGKHKTGGP